MPSGPRALFEADVIAAAELQRRQSEYQISVAETRAAADQLQLLGVTPAAIERLGKRWRSEFPDAGGGDFERCGS